MQESSCSDNISADEEKRRKSVGKPKPALSNSSTVTKPSKKAPKKSNKRNKSLSEEELEYLCEKLEERREDLDVKKKGEDRIFRKSRNLSVQNSVENRIAGRY